jgi:dTDP-glucose 4,6-dehydratase
MKSIKLGALSPTRDFSYIKDTVNGFLAVARSDKSIGEVINIGSNHEISIGETARLIAELMGVEIETVADEERLRPVNSEVERLWADNTKAKHLLGWEPAYGQRTGLRQGLRETIDWLAIPGNRRHYKTEIYNV